MRILLVYGTTEGHTRKLARFAAGRLESDACDVTLCDATDAVPADLAAYDAAVVFASLHMGRYQASVIHFAHAAYAPLNAKPSAFVSVSLAAAGDDPHDLAGLDECLARFKAATLWNPRWVHQAAGAILFSEYDFFRKLALKYIAERRGQHVRTSEDYDFTDYEALGVFLDQFVTEAGAYRPR